jgi:hypothetical protein
MCVLTTTGSSFVHQPGHRVRDLVSHLINSAVDIHAVVKQERLLRPPTATLVVSFFNQSRIISFLGVAGFRRRYIELAFLLFTCSIEVSLLYSD